MHFVIHAVDRKDALPVRAKYYRDHRIHLDRAADHGVSVMTAGTLVAADGETPVGSLFILEAADARRRRCLHRERPVPGQRRVADGRRALLQQEAVRHQ